MVDIGARQHPWAPVRWLMRNRYPSEKRIANYSGPLLQLHGVDDTLVPIDSGKQLFDACPSDDKLFIQIEDMGHNGLTPRHFYDEMKSLLTRYPLEP